MHITSAHPRHDTRIGKKMCPSLAKQEYNVYLVVADGKGDEVDNGVKIVDVGKAKGRFARMLYSAKKTYLKALALDADIYHLHDPELLPYGLKLKNKGKKVVFDSHEDYPKQFLSKPYLNKPLLKLVAKTFACFENYVCKRLSAVVGATPFITNKFLQLNKNSVNVNNYPILGELEANTDAVLPEAIKSKVCYVGGIGPGRGLYEMIQAMALLKNDLSLHLGGNFGETVDKNKLKSLPGWNKIVELGFINRNDVKHLMTESLAGLVVLRPIINYVDSLPIKMFEYMSAGLPVIASNFPLWKEIIEGNNCGICVDPLNPEEIARAIDWLYENQDKAKEMGKNGQKAVYEKYNWQNEEKTLLQLYEDLLCNFPANCPK